MRVDFRNLMQIAMQSQIMNLLCHCYYLGNVFSSHAVVIPGNDRLIVGIPVWVEQ